MNYICRVRTLRKVVGLTIAVALSTVFIAHAEVLLPEMADVPVYVLEVIHDELWIGSQDTLFKLEDGDIKTVRAGLNVSVVQEFEGVVFVGTTHGLYKLGKEDAVIPGVNVTAIQEFLGELWIGTEHSLFRYGFKEREQELSVLDLHAAEGRLWIAHSEGLSWVDSSTEAVRMVPFADRVDRPIAAITEVSGELWLTHVRNTEKGRFGDAYLLRDGVLLEADGVEDFEVTSVAVFEGLPVLGTTDGVVSSGGQLRTTKPGEVNCFFSFRGELWVGTTKGLFWKTVGSDLEKRPVVGGLNIKTINYYGGALWFGAMQGLFRVDPHSNMLGSSGTGRAVKYGRFLRPDDILPDSYLTGDQRLRWCVARTYEDAIDSSRECFPINIDWRYELGWLKEDIYVALEDQWGGKSDVAKYEFFVMPRRGLIQLFLVNVFGLVVVSFVIRRLLIDKLTGLYRKGHYGRLILAWRFRRMKSRRWALLMMDIDDFKRFNKDHGEQIGDSVLAEVGSRIQFSVRKRDRGPGRIWSLRADLPIRWGGEEFVVLLCDMDGVDAVRSAERIRENIARDLKVGGESLNVTVSIGVCDSSEGITSLKEARTLADYRMRRAKCKGKNRVVSTGTIGEIEQEMKEEKERLEGTESREKKVAKSGIGFK